MVAGRAEMTRGRTEGDVVTIVVDVVVVDVVDGCDVIAVAVVGVVVDDVVVVRRYFPPRLDGAAFLHMTVSSGIVQENEIR
jgi:hypothetical protein